jgi:hypothetical protein
MLSQDVMQSQPQKAGVIAPDGWVAYARNGHLFVKRFHYRRDAAYADLGCPVEVFTNADMLEIETLGPLTDLQPNAEIEHVEHWFLFHNVLMPQEEVDVDRATLPKIREATASLLG